MNFGNFGHLKSKVSDFGFLSHFIFGIRESKKLLKESKFSKDWTIGIKVVQVFLFQFCT